MSDDACSEFNVMAKRLASFVSLAAAGAQSAAVGVAAREMALLSPELAVDLAEALLAGKPGAEIELAEKGYAEASAEALTGTMMGCLAEMATQGSMGFGSNWQLMLLGADRGNSRVLLRGALGPDPTPRERSALRLFTDLAERDPFGGLEHALDGRGPMGMDEALPALAGALRLDRRHEGCWSMVEAILVWVEARELGEAAGPAGRGPAPRRV